MEVLLPIVGLSGRMSDILKSKLSVFNEVIEENTVFGETLMMSLDDTQNETRRVYCDYSQVSHVVKHVWFNGEELTAKIFLLKHYIELSELGVEFQGTIRWNLPEFDEDSSDKENTETIYKLYENFGNIITIDLQYGAIPVVEDMVIPFISEA